MIRLFAKQLDAAIPEIDEAIVAYSFPTACYLNTPDGELVLIVASSTGGMPNGIVVPYPADFSFSEIVPTGTSVSLRAGVLRFEGAGLTIDIRNAEKFGPASRRATIDFSSTHDSTEQARPMLDRIAASRSPEAVEMFGAGRPKLDPQFVEHWIGRGPGLTPAGDDFLVGVLAAGWVVETVCNHPNVIKTVAANLGRTSEVSRVLLSGAMRGVFPSRLDRLAGLIADGRTGTELAGSVRSLVHFGHSSGASMAYGLLAGYESILAESTVGRLAA